MHSIIASCSHKSFSSHQFSPYLPMAIDRAMFSLHRKEVMLVNPSKPTPSTILSLSTIDNDLNLDLLCQTIYVFKGNIASDDDDGYDLASAKMSRQLDPASVLREALSKALVYYYPLGGKLRKDTIDGRLQIDCEDVAVPFLEAIANCELSAVRYLDGVAIETAEQFVFDFPTGNSSVSHPLVVQVTKFACGGFTIGIGLSHSVCDGYGAAQFFRAMTEFASGRNEPTVKPVWERERLQGKLLKEPIPLLINKADAAFSPYLPTTELSHEIFYIDIESIRRLKRSLMKENDQCPSTRQESFTTVEALGAYVWRSRTKALKLNYDGKTTFLLTMGIRHLFNQPLPEGYYGNAFVGSRVEVTVRDLIERPLSEAVKLIKESKKMVSQGGYIENTLDMLETLRQKNIKAEANSGASMILTEWRQLGLLEEVDFGWKQSVNVIPVPWNMFGYVDLCIFLPPSKLDPFMKGGVRVLHSLPKAALPVFKEEMEKLKLGGYTLLERNWQENEHI